MKLTFSKPKFIHYVKNNQQVTKCIYKCKIVTSAGAITDDFVVDGYAICSPNDTYDSRIGEIIADSRAKNNAYTRCRNKLSSCILDKQAIIAAAWEMANFYNKMQFLKKQEMEHLEFILNENNT